MIDINDNDFKLLKMTASLLDKNCKDDIVDLKSLEMYKDLAIKIDKKSYATYIDKVNNYNHVQPLEDEIKYLDELENAYIQLEELQCKLKKSYSRYTNDILVLSDISVIDIDTIRYRKSLISGYLINLKNIEDSKEKLEKDSEKLVDEEKKKDFTFQQFDRLERELKESFLKAEGRISSSLTYTSVLDEYRENNIDLKKVNNNPELLDGLYREANIFRKEKEDLLITGNICYENDPSQENRDIIEGLKLETIKARYKLSLLKIAKLVFCNKNNYDDLIYKREELLENIKNRKIYLEKMGKKLVVDPFSRIKIQEQLKYINDSLFDNTKIITKLRKEINNINKRMEELEKNNGKFLREINTTIVSLIKDKTTFLDKVSEENEQKIQEVLNNQVMSIFDLPKKINIRIVKEKSIGVIKRVNEMINISKVQDDLEDKNNSELELDEFNAFSDNNLLNVNEKENSQIVSDQVDKLSLESSIFEMSSIFDSVNSNDTSGNEKIFEDNGNNPFMEPYFYSNRTSQDKIDDVMEKTSMPDVFWDTNKNNNTENGQEVISLDEQIKKLKLVA